jgi:pyruvate dehydrogenase E2 component (dihydrolipoamide acetyltransferase)
MIDFKVPELGENINSGDVVKILVSVGDVVKVDQTVVELETDKAVVEIPSSVSGQIAEILISEGDKARVGQVVMRVEGVESVAAPVQKSSVVKMTPAAQAKNLVAPIKIATFQTSEPALRNGELVLAASPTVRRLARELGVDIDKVVPTGLRGRVTNDDVMNFARALNTQVKKESHIVKNSVPVSEATLPDFSNWGEIERKPMSSVRRKTSHHLTEAWHIPHVTQAEKADITEMENFRKKMLQGKFTMTVILLHVLGRALKVFPQFNASVDAITDEIIFKKYIHIGIAVDTDRGLLVPVIRDVDKKDLKALSAEVAEKAEAARQRKLKIEDMQGGTFTVTNLGGIGGTHFTPIINAPEVAILGLSRGQVEPIYIKEKFEPRLMLPLSLSYDHRLIDGADAMRFLRWIVEALQEPLSIS